MAGTGSIAFGCDESGTSARCGGWNEFFGDEGSCHWVGRRVMELFSKQADGRIPRAALYDIIRTEFSLQNDYLFMDIMEREYQPKRDRTAGMQIFAEKAALAGDQSCVELYKEAAAHANEGYKLETRALLEQIAKRDWNNAVVLADGAVSGIAEEGALAFTEIAMLHGRSFNLLDYRHGPIVLNDAKTLTIVLARPGEQALQSAMISDLISHGGTVVTVSEHADNHFGAFANIQIKGIDSFEAWGIPFIYVMQMTAFAKAIELGGNPDAPTGLDAFITLK